MKRSLFLLLLIISAAVHSQQLLVSSFSMSGAGQGAGSVPSFFSSFGQPLMYPRTAASQNGGGAMVVSEFMFPSIQLASEPSAQPTGLTFTSLTSTSFTVSFVAPASVPSGYIVLRKQGSTFAPDEIPSDGVTYNAGDVLGVATVVSVGTTISIPQTGLSSSTQYAFAVFSYNTQTGRAINYLTDNPLAGNIFTLSLEPEQPATNVIFNNVTSSSISVAWDSPATPPAGYLVVRRKGAAPTTHPSDGTTYVAGDLLGGNSTVAYVGSELTVTNIGLDPLSLYHYRVYVFNGSGSTVNYLTTSSAIGSTTTLEPGDEDPTNLLLTTSGSTEIVGSFTAAVQANVEGYIVLRSSSLPDTNPVDGIIYTVGMPLGNAVVAAVGGQTSFVDTGLSPSTMYTYKVLSYTNSSSPDYLGTGISGSQVTLANEPAKPESAEYSIKTASSFRVSISTTDTPTGFLVLRKTGSAPSGIPQNGQTYPLYSSLGDGLVVHVGAEIFFQQTGLTALTTYHYAIYAYNGTTGTYHYSDVLNSSTSTLALSAGSGPSAFMVSHVSESEIDFSYAPAASPVTGYLILRKEGSEVTGIPVGGMVYTPGDVIGDAKVVYKGTSTVFEDNDLQPATQYHYKIFAYNGDDSNNNINYLISAGLPGTQKTYASEPFDQPTSLIFSTVTSSSLTGNFVSATGGADGYLIVRNAGTDAFNGTFTDGQTYVANQMIGNGSVTSVGSNTSFDETGLQAEQDYRYTVFAYNGSEGSYNYRLANPLTNTVTMGEAPQTQPTNLVFSNVTESSLTGSFTAAEMEPDGGYLVLRRQGALPTGQPQDGVTYSAGDNIGDGKVISVEDPATLTFLDTNLAAAQTYYYLVFAFSGTAYEIISPLSGSQMTLVTEPGTQPSFLSFTDITPSSYRVNFTLPTGGLPVIVIRNAASAPTFAPQDGVSYTVGEVTGGTIVSVGTANFLVETGLSNATRYFYTLYAYNGNSATTNYRITSPLMGDVTTLAASPSVQPTGLTFINVSSTGADVFFTAATTPPTGYVVLRKQSIVTEVPMDGVPYAKESVIGDAQVVHVGGTTSFEQTGLSSETTYYYKVFSYNGSEGTINYLEENALSDNMTTLATEPPAPDNIVVDQATTTSLRITITDSNSPDGYLVVRSMARFEGTPEDGVTYEVNDVIDDAVIVSIGAATVLQQNDLAPGTSYFYTGFSYNGSGKSTNYSSAGAEDDEPTETINQAQPTDLQFSNVDERQMDISFIAPVPPPGSYLIVRKGGSSPAFVPVDGIVYAIGQSVGDNTTVVASGSASTNYTIPALDAGTVYFYKVFSYTGTDYVAEGPLTGSRSTLAEEPIPPSALDFDNVSASGYDVLVTNTSNGYLVIRRQGSAPTFTPVDATTYIAGQSVAADEEVIVYVGNAASFTESGLTADTEYHYAAYAYSGVDLAINYYLDPFRNSQQTSLANSNQPTDLQFTAITHNRLGLSFEPPVNVPTGYIAIRGDGFVPTGSPQNGSSYSVGNTLINGSGFVAYVGTVPEFINTNLEEEELYHYRIYSYFGTGGGTTFALESPLSGSKATLAEEPVGLPSSFAASLITHNSLFISFTPVAASGYLIVRSTVAPGADPSAPLDGVRYNVGDPLGADGSIMFVGNASVNIPQTDLDDATTYYYRIYAYRGRLLESAYPTYNYHDDFLLGQATTLPEDTSEPSLDLSQTPSSVTMSSNIVVVADADEQDQGSVLTSVTMRYRSLTGSTTFSQPMTMSLESGSYRKQIEGNAVGELGVEYEVTATNSFGLSNIKTAKTKVSFTDPEIPPSQLLYGTNQSKYNIISVPLIKGSENRVSDIFEELGPVDNHKWRMFHYVSASELQELNLTSTIVPGNGYWLITKNETALSLGDGTSVDVTASGFEIPLQLGYNQIGNPYMFDISWADVQEANGITSALKTFDGNFIEDTELKQFEGGFVLRGETDPATLVIPPKKHTGGRIGIKKTNHHSLSSNEWQVNFILENENRTNAFGGIGMHPNAQTGWDIFDDFTLPRLGEYIELNHDKERFAGLMFTKDIVPTAGEHTWRFETTTNLERASTLRWDNSYFGENESVLILWDETEQRAIDMREVSQYQFTGTRFFKVIFGNESYVKEQARVHHFVMHSIYPNPSSGAVFITFSLPNDLKSQHVIITVLNQLGQAVAKVFEGDLDSGFHELQWNGVSDNGTLPAVGVYTIQIECGYEHQSKRIVIK